MSTQHAAWRAYGGPQMSIDEMFTQAETGQATVADGWGQGRATYGGIVAGMLLARAEALCADSARTLRTASVVFAGPVAPGEATIDGTVLRAGSSATHVDVKMVQEGTVRAAMLASFGAPRETAVSFHSALRDERPELPEPESVYAVPFIEGVTPAFIEHVELRYASGGLPVTAAAEPDFGGWMRFRQAPQQFGMRELIALTDAWPPALLPMFEQPAPISTLTWTFQPIPYDASDVSDDPEAHWQYDARTVAADGGYTQANARVWDRAGRLRAISTQTVAYFG